MRDILLRCCAFAVAWAGTPPQPTPAQASAAAVSTGTASQTGPELQITVKVYNSAQVSAPDLTRAEALAARIFQKAGIKVVWVAGLTAWEVNEPSATATWSPGHIHLRIWTRSMAKPTVVGGDTLGFCLSMEKSQAVVLFDAVQSLADVRFSDSANLLGLAMAHELGHLLLRSASHSDVGIMQARWLSKDLRDGEEGLLVFTRDQSSLMRTEVLRRMRKETLAAAPILFFGALGATNTRTALKIEVNLYRHSGVRAATLARAEQETTRHLWAFRYRYAGADLSSYRAEELAPSSACNLHRPAPTRFTVRLLSSRQAVTLRWGHANAFASRVLVGGGDIDAPKGLL